MESVKISERQAVTYIIMLILPTAILFVPSITAKWGEQDAWFSLIIALDIGIIAAWVSSKLAMCFPNETIIQFLPKIIGNFLGKIIGLIFAFHFYFLAYATQRQFSVTMVSRLIPETPAWFVIAVITSFACYAVYTGIEALSRANNFIFSVIIIYGLFLLSISVMSFNPSFLRPVFDVSINKLLMAAITPASWLTECSVILMLTPFLNKPEKALRITISAVIVIFLIMFIIMLITLGIFGHQILEGSIFSTFEAMEPIVYEEITVLDFLDVVMMSIWVFGMAFKITTALFVGTLAIAQLFNLSSYKLIIVPGGILTVILALNSWVGVVELLDYSEMVFPAYLITIGIILPAILLMLVKIRGKGIKEVNTIEG